MTSDSDHHDSNEQSRRCHSWVYHVKGAHVIPSKDIPNSAGVRDESQQPLVFSACPPSAAARPAWAPSQLPRTAVQPASSCTVLPPRPPGAAIKTCYPSVGEVRGGVCQSMRSSAFFQVFGQAMIPGAAMLEAALSAARLLAHGQSLGALSPALVAVSMPAPLTLTAAKPATMECLLSLSASAASVAVHSNMRPGQTPAVHLRGNLVCTSGQPKHGYLEHFKSRAFA